MEPNLTQPLTPKLLTISIAKIHMTEPSTKMVEKTQF